MHSPSLTSIFSLALFLKLQPNPLPLLALANLKHDLHADKQYHTRRGQEGQSTPAPHNRGHHALEPVQPDGEADQVRRHHHEDVSHSADATDHAIRVRSVPPPVCGEQRGGQDLGQDEQGDEPAPHQEPEVDVVPDRDKGEDGQGVGDTADPGPCALIRSAAAAAAAATDRHVDVPDDPAVEAAVPAPPEREGRVVVAHAPDHVLRGVDAVEQGPEPEEAEGDEELEPDDVQVEVAEHAELEGRVRVPVGGGGADGDRVDVVEHEFHAEEHQQESDGVEGGARAGEGWGSVRVLGDVVVEGQDGPGQVEGRVERVGEVGGKAEVGIGRRGEGDAVTFGEGGRVELFLLGSISRL
jgi:hypothetical protein